MKRTSKENRKMIINTNTAYLLNMLFSEPTIWKKQAEICKKWHEEHWSNKNNGFVKLTFEII